MGSGSSSRRRGAAGPRGKAAENRELPETAPARSEGAAAPAPARPAPAAGRIPEPRPAGSCGQLRAGGGGAALQQAALSTRSSSGPENNNAGHQSPESNSKKPSGQSTISYDYSEEELMASIEQEYCR